MLSDKPITIYLRWPERDLLALSPLVRLLWGSIIDALITSFDSQEGRGCKPVLLLVDEAGRTAIPSLADHATTVVGRSVALWIAVQSLEQLKAEYGEARSGVLIDNMETQLYCRPNGIETAKYLSDCLGRISAYAHSTTLREGEESAQGLLEQGVPLITPQEIKQMKDEEVIGFHRRLPPFRIRRMDWRGYALLRRRRSIPAPQLPHLSQLAAMPMEKTQAQTYRFSSGYFDVDLIHKASEKTIINLAKREQEADRLN